MEGNPAPPESPRAAGGPARKPRSIALFFDDTHSGPAGFERSRQAARKLIEGGLAPGDRIGIFTGSGAVEQDFTADTPALLAVLGKMHSHTDASLTTGFLVCPTLTAYQAYVIAKHLDNQAKIVAALEIMGCFPGTPWPEALRMAQSAGETAWEQLGHQSANLLDVLLLIVRHLAAQPGDRMLLMVSPGFVSGDWQKQIGTFTDTCLRNRIVVNALDDEGLLGSGLESPESLHARTGPRAGWAEQSLSQRELIVTGFLAEAAEATGGRFLHHTNDLTSGLRELAAAPEVSYLLGFSPANPPDGKYHKLKVTVARAGDTISSRPGYFSTIRAAEPETAQQRIDRVVSSREVLGDVPATVTVMAVPEKSGWYRIQVDIRLDARGLPFSSENGASLQQLTFVTVLEDAAGNFVEGKQAVMDMRLSAATRADLEAKGIKAATFFLAPKGSYRVREVIREAVHNQMAASFSTVEIP